MKSIPEIVRDNDAAQARYDSRYPETETVSPQHHTTYAMMLDVLRDVRATGCLPCGLWRKVNEAITMGEQNQ